MPLVSQTFDQLLDFTRTTSGTFVGSNGLIQTTPASANLLTWTQQFDNAAWSKNAVTVIANTTVAPDGTSTADKPVATATSGYHILNQLYSSVVSGTTYTVSFFVKAAEYSKVYFSDGANGRYYCTFDLASGTAGTPGGGYTGLAASIVSLANGWYRCSLRFTSNQNEVSRPAIIGYPNSGATLDSFGASYTGNGTSGIFVWGAELEAVPAANLVLGSELVTNGTFTGGSTTGWTAAGSATISGTGDVLTVTNGATAFGYAVTSITTVIGRTYYVTYQITGGTSTANLYIGTASGGFDNYAGPNQSAGSYTVAFVATATTTFLRLGNSVNTSGATSIFDNISTKEITAITGMPSTYTRNNGGVFPPRFDYDPVTLAAKGLLVEEQRTNLAYQSADFTTAYWIKNDASLTTGISDPAGGTSATTLTATAAFGILQQAVISTAGTYSASIWIRRRTGTGQVSLRCGDVTNIPITVTSSWVRYTVTAVATTTTIRLGVVLVTSGDAVDIWGGQIEAGSFATSYIPTVASQVTRTADQCSIVAPNFAPWYNQSAGTFVTSVQAVSGRLLSANDGSTANRILVFNRVSETSISANIIAATLTQASLSRTVADTSAINSVSLAYKENDFAFCANGGVVQTDGTGTVPTVSQLDIGREFTIAGVGHIRSIRYYPTRLTNAQLQALTA